MCTKESISEASHWSQNMLKHSLAIYKWRTTIFFNVIRHKSQQSKKTITITVDSKEQCELVRCCVMLLMAECQSAYDEERKALPIRIYEITYSGIWVWMRGVEWDSWCMGWNHHTCTSGKSKRHTCVCVFNLTFSMLHYTVILHALGLSIHNMVTYDIYNLCTIPSLSL